MTYNISSGAQTSGTLARRFLQFHIQLISFDIRVFAFKQHIISGSLDTLTIGAFVLIPCSIVFILN